MSFFSQLFRKSSPSSAAPAAATPTAPPAVAANAPAKPGVADRALAAAAEESALQAAIESGDVQAVARLVVAGTSSKLRQAAAHAIDDPDALRQLIRDVRGGNDKSVYKVLTAKRDFLVEKRRKLEQLQADINTASAALERHSQRPYDASYAPLLTQLETAWEAVAAQADADQSGKAQQWIARAHETIAEQARQVAAQAASLQAAANAAAEAQQLRAQQLQAAAALAAEQQQALDEQQRAQAAQQQAEQQVVREISEMIRKARGTLSGGSTARAASLRSAIEQKLQGAPPLSAALLGQLQALDQQLEELKDWKRFSVAPKRAELIEEMEALLSATFEPLVLAERIKSLQEEWRTLGKGAEENAEADQQRFEAAAQKAYQPCREYFAAQALILEENQRQRDAVLARLTAFEAGLQGEQADWQAVIKTLRDVKEEWRRYAAVDRRAAKPQQEAFTALVENLQGRLDAEYARNVAQKQALIERARAALTHEDDRKGTDAIKSLQQQWQAVGPMPRDVDQRLWGEFRQHCDAVFQKRQQAAIAHAAGLEHKKAQALALCEQVENIAALEGPALLEGAGSLADLRNAFETLGELPAADARDLRRRFDRGLDRCKESLARQHARDAERGWSDLFEAANHVRAYQLAVAHSAEPEQIAALKHAAETTMASTPRWPKRGLDALKQALAIERTADLAANALALKMLCIRAEILTDLPTPPEDQALRRDYQLQRLMQSLGQGVKADETHLDSMAIEWVGVGPVDEATYQPLLLRFRRCRERGNTKTA